jgi:hypothetical protein
VSILAPAIVFLIVNTGRSQAEDRGGGLKDVLTATGGVRTFGHVVSLTVLDIEFESMVYFFADERINKNLLGRIGWLDRVRFGLVDHDQEL